MGEALHRRSFLAACCLSITTALTPRCARAETNARWPDERQAGPFLIHADFSLEEYAGMVRELGALQDDLARYLQTGPAREYVHLYLFRKKSTYNNYLKQYFPTAPSRRALFIKGRGPGMVFAYKNKELDVDLRHEATHALLHSSLPMVPLWLDEGLAEYFEAPPQSRAHDNPHLKSIRWSLRFNSPPSIDTLESFRDLSEMGRTEYRNAWAWVHFMLHGPSAGREELLRYLADIEAHAVPGSLSRRLRQRIPRLEKQFTAHFASWRK